MFEAPPQPARESGVIPEAASPAPRAERQPKNPYIAHQADLALTAFMRDNPGVWPRLKPEVMRERAGREWVGRGYAAAYARQARHLRESHEDRLPNLDEVEPLPGDGDESLLHLRMPDGEPPTL
jgi:hypothetical protein